MDKSCAKYLSNDAIFGRRRVPAFSVGTSQWVGLGGPLRARLVGRDESWGWVSKHFKNQF